MFLRDHRGGIRWKWRKSVNIWREWTARETRAIVLNGNSFFASPRFHATDRGKGRDRKGARLGRVVTRGIRLSWHETRGEKREWSRFSSDWGLDGKRNGVVSSSSRENRTSMFRSLDAWSMDSHIVRDNCENWIVQSLPDKHLFSYTYLLPSVARCIHFCVLSVVQNLE